METKHLILLGAMVATSALLGGCGPSRGEFEQRERARIEQERQAQQAIQKSNEAVNEVSKKLGRKPPQLDLGLPPENKSEPSPQNPPKP